eukprot:2374098-Rhodomonas_salina.1
MLSWRGISTTGSRCYRDVRCQDSEELNEDCTNIYNTQALLSALIITLVFSSQGSRLSDELAGTNMWGSKTNYAIMIQVPLPHSDIIEQIARKLRSTTKRGMS